MSERTQEPNFLLVVTDQQRTDTLGAYGCELGATPHIDAMAAAGVTFPRGYCNNPLCMPSRAALLTGRYPSSTGVRTNGCTAHPGQPLLAELLAQAGYRTGAFGKVHFHPGGGEPGGYWPENRTFIESGADLTQPYLGFQTVAVGCGHGEVLPGLHAAELAEHHPDVYAKRGRDNALVVPEPWLLGAQKIETYKTAIPPEHYATTWVTDKTIDFIQSAEEPFFAWCGIPDPHHPFKPPGDYWHKFDPADMPPATCREGELDDKPPHFRSFWEGEYAGLDTDGFLLGSKGQLTDERLRIIRAAYFGMIAMIDDNVARLLAALRDRGIERNTVVVFVSDHGEFMGDHGLILKGPMHYENVLRVPFIARCPGLFEEQRSVEGLAGLIDLFPTVLELADVPIPDGTQGQSLVRQLTGESDRAHDEVYIENDVDALGLRLRTLVTERRKLTWHAGEDYGEIYDLEDDPNEFVNLWDTCDPAVKSDLMARLLDAASRNQDWLPPKTCHA